MKKTFVILLFLLPSSSLLACECVDNTSVGQTYATSDFVGIVTVVSVDKNVAKIGVLTDYKGKAPRKIEFTPALENGILGGAMCEISIKPNQEWLLAISKNKHGVYHINSCSFAVQLKNEKGDSIQSQSVADYITYFNFLKAELPNLNAQFNINESKNRISYFLNKFDGQPFEKKSAHYLISFNQKLEVDQVKVLKGLSDSFNQKLIAFLKEETSWQIIGTQPTNSTEKILYVLDIYYYKDGKNFLSIHKL